MGIEETAVVVNKLSEGVHQNGGSSGTDYRSFRKHCIEPCIDRSFDIQYFSYRLEYKIRPAQRPGRGVSRNHDYARRHFPGLHGGDQLQTLQKFQLSLYLPGNRFRQISKRPGAAFLTVDQMYRVTAEGKTEADASTHTAGADNCNSAGFYLAAYVSPPLKQLEMTTDTPKWQCCLNSGNPGHIID